LNSDEKYMLMALGLAERGLGSVEPNPMVGCVIVKDGEVIGQGFHEEFGQAHAEINALADCVRNGYSAAGATMYVTLEPCCHAGKTGPCSMAIIEAGIGHVVAAMGDVSEKVAGKGFLELSQAGIKVDVGICKESAEQLNGAFVKFARTKLPWVIVKWAQSSDGFLARTDTKRWISGPESRADVQVVRSRCQAILVGINTVIEDDPLLTVRMSGAKRKLLRVVLDSELRVPLESRILQTVDDGAVLVVCCERALQAKEAKVGLIEDAGGEVVALGGDAGGCDIGRLMACLGRRGVQQLLVEGGGEVISSFLTAGLVDEAIVYVSQEKLGLAGKARGTNSMGRVLDSAVEAKSRSVFGADSRYRIFCRGKRF